MLTTRTIILVLLPAALAGETASYLGSAACKTCHAAIYERWKKTRMANVVRDPKEHPEAIIPDLSKPDPLVTFKKDDIAFVYGSKWKQRYFTKIGDDYFPLARAVGRHAQDVAAVLRRRTAPTGGCRFYPAGQYAAADRSALRRLPFGELRHRRPRQSPNGTSAARSAMARAARMSAQPVARRTSSIRRGSTTCRPTTSASSATRRGSR